MAQKRIKTTKAQFQEFCDSVDFYVDLLGLHDWRIVKEQSAEPGDGSAALCIWDRCGRVATVVLNDTTPDDGHIDPWRHGKHEVLELLLCELVGFATAFFDSDEVSARAHAVIRRLEKALPGKPEE